MCSDRCGTFLAGLFSRSSTPLRRGVRHSWQCFRFSLTKPCPLHTRHILYVLLGKMGSTFRNHCSVGLGWLGWLGCFGCGLETTVRLSCLSHLKKLLISRLRCSRFVSCSCGFVFLLYFGLFSCFFSYCTRGTPGMLLVFLQIKNTKMHLTCEMTNQTRFIPYHAIPYHTVPHHTITERTVPHHRTVPHRTVLYHTIPYRNIRRQHFLEDTFTV